MKSLSGKQVTKLLEDNGWVLARIHGSHHIYIKEGRKERISVPVHRNRPLKRGLLTTILKIAGVKT